jgi:hypothetical protein
MEPAPHNEAPASSNASRNTLRSAQALCIHSFCLLGKKRGDTRPVSLPIERPSAAHMRVVNRCDARVQPIGWQGALLRRRVSAASCRSVSKCGLLLSRTGRHAKLVMSVILPACAGRTQTAGPAGLPARHFKR